MNKEGIISVIGCGWLGLPLAESLIARGYHVKGSTTSPSKLEILRNKGIEPYLVHFGDKKPLDAGGLFNCDVLVINIPPGRRSADGAANYRMMADIITQQVTKSGVKKVILVSSTSVFQDSNTVLSESSVPDPDSETGKLLLKVENQFLAIPNLKVCVLRPAGLVGPGRHPGRFFKEKNDVPNGLAPINLIHLEDVIGILQCLIENQTATGIYHACSPEHPGKEQFYRQAAEGLNLKPPAFIPEKKNYKIITSKRVQEDLKYGFKYPDLLDWIKDSAI